MRAELEAEESAFKVLMSISNQDIEKQMIKGFIEHVAKNHYDMLEVVVRTIPPTPKGEILFKSLFGCSAEDYLATKQEEHQRSSMRPI